jgi:hypothetical protein
MQSLFAVIHEIALEEVVHDTLGRGADLVGRMHRRLGRRRSGLRQAASREYSSYGRRKSLRKSQ